MEYRTKLDFSSNRQVKQFPETITVLSGATSFGIPFSALTVGPDPSTSGVSSTQLNPVSTFSGNSGTSVYTWFDTIMSLGESALSAWTGTNSGLTQNTGNIFTASSTTIIDGNTVALAYTGVNFDLSVVGMVSLGGGAYSGTVYTSVLNILSAGTLDFTGRTIWVDVSGITRTDSLIVNTSGATFLSIGAGASAGALHYTSGGVLTTNTSDERLKTNIQPVTNALSKVLALKGVYYNWTEEPNGDRRIGFLAQDVMDIVPELAFVNKNSPDKFMGVHYDNFASLLVEAIKELAKGTNITQNTRTELKTQTIIAEDNNIDLNFNGTVESSIGGGIEVMYALGKDKHAELKIDENGNWTTNNSFKPKSLIIPYYTPISSSDTKGYIGNLTNDDDYLYLKVDENNWRRIKLESF
jgi:hypothetical protein